MALDIDRIIPKDADLGPYDVIVVAMATYVMTISSSHVMAPNFLFPHVDHRCEIPPLDHLPEDLVDMLAIPWDWPRMEYSSCEEYDVDWAALDLNLTGQEDLTWWDLPHVNTTDSRTCSNGWLYDLETYGPTATSEWDLVCSRSWLLQVLSPVALAGLFVGSLFCGSVANRIGRRRAIVLFEAGLIACGIAASFSTAPEMLICFRFLVGAFAASSLLVSCVLIMEIVPSRRRVLMAGVFNVGYGLGMILLTACAYFIRHFRFLQLALAILGMPIISYLWLLPESPRWLISVGRVEEAVSELADICRRNKRTIPENLLFVTATQKSAGVAPETETQKTKANTGSCLAFLRHPAARKYLFIISMCWATANFTFMGVSLNISGLFGDPYLNGVISGVIDTVAILLASAGLQRLRRKVVMMAMWGIIAAAGFVPIAAQVLRVYPEVTTVCALLARSTASATFVGLYGFAGELFPTSLRSAAVGVAAGTGHLVSLVAPFVCGPAVSSLWPWLPNLVYGVLGVIAAIITSGLAETLGRDLPQTLEDVGRMTKDKQYKSDRDTADDKCHGVTNLGFCDVENLRGYEDFTHVPTTSYGFCSPDNTQYNDIFVITKEGENESVAGIAPNDIVSTFVTKL